MFELTGLLWCCTCSWGREDMLCSLEENDRLQYPTWKIILWGIKTGLYIILCSLSEASGAIISVIVTYAQEFFHCKYELHSLCILTASQFNRNWSLTTFRCTVSWSVYIFTVLASDSGSDQKCVNLNAESFRRLFLGDWPYFFMWTEPWVTHELAQPTLPENHHTPQQEAQRVEISCAIISFLCFCFSKTNKIQTVLCFVV